MNDQEKSNFLKAKLLAEKSSGLDKNAEANHDIITNANKLTDGLNKFITFVAYIIYFLSVYAAQHILFKRVAITPFSLWESAVIFYAAVKSITLVGKFILALKTKV